MLAVAAAKAVSSPWGSIGAIVGIIAALAAAIVILRGTMRKTTAEVWRENAEALTQRVDVLEAENGHLRDRVGQLEATNTTLQTVIGATPAIERLETHLAGILTTLDSNMNDLMREMAALARSVGSLSGQLKGIVK